MAAVLLLGPTQTAAAASGTFRRIRLVFTAPGAGEGGAKLGAQPAMRRHSAGQQQLRLEGSALRCRG